MLDWSTMHADWQRGMDADHRRHSLWTALRDYDMPLILLCGCDHLGSPRILTDEYGNILKEIQYDSFGVVLEESFPELFLPLGFAGGLRDADTGLIRFGMRDYLPEVGRFTAPDPARDLRGDGDLYDYCVDDPVNRVDPTGLWSKATFEESRVRRDERGRFGSGGGSSNVMSGPRDGGEAGGETRDQATRTSESSATSKAETALTKLLARGGAMPEGIAEPRELMPEGLAKGEPLPLGVEMPEGEGEFKPVALLGPLHYGRERLSDPIKKSPEGVLWGYDEEGDITGSTVTTEDENNAYAKRLAELQRIEPSERADIIERLSPEDRLNLYLTYAATLKDGQRANDEAQMLLQLQGVPLEAVQPRDGMGRRM